MAFALLLVQNECFPKIHQDINELIQCKHCSCNNWWIDKSYNNRFKRISFKNIYSLYFIIYLFSSKRKLSKNCNFNSIKITVKLWKASNAVYQNNYNVGCWMQQTTVKLFIFLCHFNVHLLSNGINHEINWNVIRISAQ